MTVVVLKAMTVVLGAVGVYTCTDVAEQGVVVVSVFVLVESVLISR